MLINVLFMVFVLVVHVLVILVIAEFHAKSSVSLLILICNILVMLVLIHGITIKSLVDL